jgi:hypothetical protein
MAILLEWGEVTITRYENGAIQDPAHNEVLMFIQEPSNMKEIFDRNGFLLPPVIRESLKKKIDDLLNCEHPIEPTFSLWKKYVTTRQSVDEYSGFRGFDIERIINMIIYIAQKEKGVFTTKLNKLLWYADFVNFKKLSQSVSGSSYVHLPLGPVPNDYEWIIALAINEKLISQEEIVYPSGASGISYKALKEADKSIFSAEEIASMDFVLEFFKSFNCKEIKKRAHEEKAYKETRETERISYKYASFLSI